jgi:flagellar basal body-associated protein FliL
MAIIVLAIFVLVIGAMGFMVYMRLNNVKMSTGDNNIQSSQDFFPYKDIRENAIDLGENRYRAIIECSSLSYDLKTEKEKNVIEMSYQRFVNSLTFPIFQYIQTTVFDNRRMLEQLSSEISSSIQSYPQIREYAEEFMFNISRLDQYTKSNRIKRKFIIIPYDEAAELEKLTKEEKEKYALSELSKRTNIIIDGLSSIGGLKSRRLTNAEIARVLYSSTKKDHAEHMEDLLAGYYTSTIVGNDRASIHKIGEDEKLDWVLGEAENRIVNEVMYEDMPKATRKHFEECLNEVRNIRKKYAGFYKEES